MEAKIKAKFITDFYGSAPALGAQALLEKHIQDKNNQAFLSFLDAIKKKGETAIDKAAEILSIFHRDPDGNPVLGNWMFRRCLVETGLMFFNALKDKTHPKKSVIQNAFMLVEPVPFISISNGKVITKPAGVKTYTVSTKGKSFFKAYEYIPAGTTFEASVIFDEDMLKPEHAKVVFDKCGHIGVGAFRERFGKFEMV